MALGTLEQTQQVVHILGVRFHSVSRRAAVEQLLHWIAEKSRRMVITAGPEFVMKTLGDASVQRVTQAADLITPDGIGVVWAARRKGVYVPERVTGVELIEDLLDVARDRHQSLRVYILGASEESMVQCLAALTVKYPNHVFAGRNGYFNKETWSSIEEEIRTFAPDVWLVGLGQPKQELLIYQTLGALPPCIGIGVGGSIDVWGGTVPRAPRLVRRMNLEWLYRLLRQPSRWRRQLALPRFAWKVLRNTDGKAQ